MDVTPKKLTLEEITKYKNDLAGTAWCDKIFAHIAAMEDEAARLGADNNKVLLEMKSKLSKLQDAFESLRPIETGEEIVKLCAEVDEWKDNERVSHELFEAACKDIGALQDRIEKLRSALEECIEDTDTADVISKMALAADDQDIE